jgi:hypothetical protein
MFYVTRTVLVELAILWQSFWKNDRIRLSNNFHKDQIYLSIPLQANTSLYTYAQSVSLPPPAPPSLAYHCYHFVLPHIYYKELQSVMLNMG